MKSGREADVNLGTGQASSKSLQEGGEKKAWALWRQLGSVLSQISWVYGLKELFGLQCSHGLQGGVPARKDGTNARAVSGHSPPIPHSQSKNHTRTKLAKTLKSICILHRERMCAHSWDQNCCAGGRGGVILFCRKISVLLLCIFPGFNASRL